MVGYKRLKSKLIFNVGTANIRKEHTHGIEIWPQCGCRSTSPRLVARRPRVYYEPFGLVFFHGWVTG